MTDAVLALLPSPSAGNAETAQRLVTNWVNDKDYLYLYPMLQQRIAAALDAAEARGREAEREAVRGAIRAHGREVI